jgi:SAM-dependent methyltransferase
MAPNIDPYGKACYDFLNGKRNILLEIESDVAEMDPLPVKYLFREIDAMPEIEQTALKLAKGNILDVGAGAGSHSLILQNAGKSVTALEISPLLCKVMQERQIKHIIQSDIFQYNETQFDTILFLMNGIGMCRDFNGLSDLLQHLKSILAPDGQILLDSSDLIYLFMNEEGIIEMPILENYYGEFPFTMKYDSDILQDQWLYIDPDNLIEIANNNAYECVIIQEGKHYDYLAKLTLKK